MINSLKKAVNGLKAMKAMAGSICVMLLGMGINILSYFLGGDILIGKMMYGGEWTGKVGFGILCNTVYPLTVPGISGETHSWLSFSWSNFFITFAIIFVILFVIIWVRSLSFGKKDES